MAKRKVFIAIHQLNIGGAQKAFLSALDAIDYEKNDVTVYVRKDRLDLLPLVNKGVSRVIINRDKTKYYRKPYSIVIILLTYLCKFFKKDTYKLDEKIKNYLIKSQIKYEKKHHLSDDVTYDVAISYIQGYTAKSVIENVKANKKIMFYHDSTDSLHNIHTEIMPKYNKIYCVSEGAMQAVKSFYPQFADKIDYIENFVDYKKIREDADAFDPEYDKSKLILCSCGRMTSVKGFDLAVKAAEVLKDNGLDFRWYFVSDGAERENIEALISEKMLSDNIVITGLVDNPYPYIKNCDIYVQPSYEEAQSLSLIEGQILAKVIVTTATVGGRVVVEDKRTGLVCGIDGNSIAEKILFVAGNKDLQSKITDKLKEKDYSKDYRVFCEKWEKLLEE